MESLKNLIKYTDTCTRNLSLYPLKPKSMNAMCLPCNLTKLLIYHPKKIQKKEWGLNVRKKTNKNNKRKTKHHLKHIH